MPEADDILAPLAVHGLVPGPGILENFFVSILWPQRRVLEVMPFSEMPISFPSTLGFSLPLAVSSIYCRQMLLLFSLPWYPSVYSALCCPLLEASPAFSPAACATEHRAPESVTT